jgi:hypothetical protein
VLINVHQNFLYAANLVVACTYPSKFILNQIVIIQIRLVTICNEQYQINEMNMTTDARLRSFTFSDRLLDKIPTFIGSQSSRFAF